MALSALKRKTAGRQIADELRDHIVRGELIPGERLTENMLAERFGVSRGSVRAALQLLQQEGLIEQAPYSGWSVSTLTVTDVWELCTLRACLEGLAAELAAERIDRDGESRLTTVFERLVELADSGDARAIAGADFDLHKTIVQLSGHRRLEMLYGVVEQQIRMYIASSDEYGVGSGRGVLIPHHKPIYEAIMNGDSALAAHLSQQHNETEGPILIEHIQTKLSPAKPAVSPSRRRGRPPRDAALRQKYVDQSS